MARVWFIVSLVIQIVYANEMNIRNCDECMRKGGTWCKERGSDHCSLTPPDDDWCPNDREQLPPMSSSLQVKQQFLKERMLYIGTPAQLKLPYSSSTKPEISVSIINSTQSSNIAVSVHHTDCDGSECVTTIQATPGLDFCLSNGGIHEYAYANVAIGNKTNMTIKYHVACACMCSRDVKMNSPACNEHGNFSCGTCSCNEGWSGEFCEIKMQHNGEGATKGGGHKTWTPTKGGRPTVPTIIGIPSTGGAGSCVVERKSSKCNYRGDYDCGSCQCYDGWSGANCETQICEGKRGDLQCTNPARIDVECSGNGYCGPCDTCVCYNDREGAQYFDESEYCTDLCMLANGCDTCLVNNTLGECTDCQHYMTSVPYNESFTHIRDSFNRRVWVKCNETVDGCYVEYWAMRNENEEITFMVQSSCNDVEVAYSTAGPKVPLILGILGIIAAVAAVGGVVAWKHFNAVPPLPLSDPEYQNIDAEDCTGENPLYKSPMSSFKNPTYGKW